MIRKILITIFIMILLAGCMTSQPAEPGTIQLTSSPSGAEIYLDSQYRGTTPSTIAGIDPGNHTLEFRSPGHASWKSTITVPSGTSNYFAALSALAVTPQVTYTSPVTTPVPAMVTVRVSREQMIVGDSNTFSGTAEGTDSVILTLYGPGYYANGIVLDTVRPAADGSWSYSWTPGSAIQSGTYTMIATDTGRTGTDRVQFRVIGKGVVTVIPSSYAIAKGETFTLSGRCTTGATAVSLVLFGPERFTGGMDLGTITVTAEQTWSYQYKTDLTMPAGVYSVYVSDVPKTTSGTTQFTIGFAS